MPLDAVTAPGKRVQYLGRDGAWKADLPPAERMVLFHGDTGNSVTFYPDVQQWVMVCGPGFLNNKIRLRTAPALEGPWSEERVVYECPEQTPGSERYDKDNFCYLGRDHKEFYDPKTRTLRITYDVNTANAQAFVSNLNIYSPKVLAVPLKK